MGQLPGAQEEKQSISTEHTPEVGPPPPQALLCMAIGEPKPGPCHGDEGMWLCLHFLVALQEATISQHHLREVANRILQGRPPQVQSTSLITWLRSVPNSSCTVPNSGCPQAQVKGQMAMVAVTARLSG